MWKESSTLTAESFVLCILFTPPCRLSLGLHNLVAHHISKTAEKTFKPARIERQERLSGKFHKSILSMKGVVDLANDPSCGNAYRVKFVRLESTRTMLAITRSTTKQRTLTTMIMRTEERKSLRTRITVSRRGPRLQHQSTDGGICFYRGFAFTEEFASCPERELV
jgi:hypothetical protein